MVEFKRVFWDIAYGSLGGVYVSIMIFIERFISIVKEVNHNDFDFWWGKITAGIVFILVVVYHVRRILQQNKKHKHEVQTQSYFDAYIIAGDELRKVKHYDLALNKFNKALELNFDNEVAQNKINEVKYLIDAAHK